MPFIEFPWTLNKAASRAACAAALFLAMESGATDSIGMTEAAAGMDGRAKARLAGEFREALKTGLLEAWYPRCIDDEFGGFLCDFDYSWRPSGPHDKMMPFQARQTWVASKAASLFPRDPRYRRAADHGFACLRDTMWDKKHGGWYWILDRQGEPKPPWETAKHAYGISFGIYALGAYCALSQDRAALDLAREAFAWLEKHAHDGGNGGYYEFFRRDGTLIVDAGEYPDSRGHDCMGNPIGFKSMNSHIHLLEALTELYAVWPDRKLRSRLEELLLIVRDRICVPPGAMHLFFNPDWVPVPDHDSYGHDVETAFLLLEAAEALGAEHDPKTRTMARSLVDHALAYGWDFENGGFYYGGSSFGEIFNRDKSWWVQAEGLNALLLMAREFPQDRARYEASFLALWEYVKRDMLDREHGGWHHSGLDTGKGPRQAKGSVWKASYHTARSLSNCLKMLEERP